MSEINDDVKIKVIDSDKLINAINEGSYEVNLSAVMALGAFMLDTKKQESTSDSISKQVAVEAITSYNGVVDKSVAKRILIQLPSAQPTLNNQINLCDTCKHNYPDCPAGEDDVLYGNGEGNDNICACGKYEAERRNTGRWVDVGSGLSVWPWKCSVCGGRQSVISDFCPDCGSKMKSSLTSAIRANTAKSHGMNLHVMDVADIVRMNQRSKWSD